MRSTHSIVTVVLPGEYWLPAQVGVPNDNTNQMFGMDSHSTPPRRKDILQLQPHCSKMMSAMEMWKGEGCT